MIHRLKPPRARKRASSRAPKSWLQSAATRVFANAAVCVVLLSGEANAAPPEFRAAWVATVYNLDWPSKPGLPSGQQQAELRALLDRAAELKLNAILLQVRPACDALYASKLEPWSHFLTGKMGAPPEPYYDPLAFAVKEAHARGLQLHAWFNPFRALANVVHPTSANHVSKMHAEWVRRYGAQLWLDPGEPEARAYAIEVMLDVVRRYDVDGVHIDDYFYPYPIKGGVDFPDETTWRRYAGGANRGDWRRENVNRFVEALYRGIKREKPSVKFGISPFGIWRPGVPATTEAQLDAYGQLYADARKWLQEGWCDYLSPQLYWSIAPAKQSFPVLLDWWRSQSTSVRPVWPGIAVDRIGPTRPATEIERQIELARQNTPSGTSPGHIHWSMKSLLRNRGGISDLLGRGVYREKAAVP